MAYGPVRATRATAVSPARSICLGRQKHALTRYNYRCDLRLGSLWLRLADPMVLVAGGQLTRARKWIRSSLRSGR